ncbi:hypothetical protein COV61_04615 [Candidatus Micrarchaeota archaeon CG11_big_fil_rev_8_21_14_0_20_47_5]|nr:MAG: hypothetical protein AUJ17_03050 [Candidatus Micrarchaeota archaeon CG1_02_47_40]PIN82908.1 MAG: hypothetical protein COV61_04615 [Candidatus Micrarchaeota archaeon CG11_big_fil_rev_8_21_14_0_20_47_5]
MAQQIAAIFSKDATKPIGRNTRPPEKAIKERQPFMREGPTFASDAWLIEKMVKERKPLNPLLKSRYGVLLL